HGAAVFAAVLPGDHARQTMNSEDAALDAGSLVNSRHRRAAGLRLSAGVMTDRPLSRKARLGPHPLLCQSGFLIEAMLMKASCPTPLPRRLGPVFSQFDSDFFLFRHTQDLESDLIRLVRRGV